jgi:hypothetical protein
MRMKLYSISNKNDAGMCHQDAAKIWQAAHSVHFDADSDSIRWLSPFNGWLFGPSDAIIWSGRNQKEPDP